MKSNLGAGQRSELRTHVTGIGKMSRSTPSQPADELTRRSEPDAYPTDKPVAYREPAAVNLKSQPRARSSAD